MLEWLLKRQKNCQKSRKVEKTLEKLQKFWKFQKLFARMLEKLQEC